MPLCQKSSKCNHAGAVHTIWDGLGNCTVQCEICMLTGGQCKNESAALASFYANHINSDKENEMSQTYEQGYKRGVIDAGEKILNDMPLRGITDAVDLLNEIPRWLRKNLLTKKVTKWFAVYNNEGSGGLRIVGQFTNSPGNGLGNAELFDTKEEALAFLNVFEIAVPVGAFPFEVEVEL